MSQNNKHSNHPYDTQTLSDFLAGRLPEDQAKEIEAALEHDPLLLAALEEMDKSGVGPDDLSSKVSDFEKQMLREVRGRAKREKGGGTVWIRYAASIVLVLGIASVLWMTAGTDNGARFEPYVLQSDAMRGGEAQEDQAEEAFKLYHQERYSEAIDLFEQLPEDHPKRERILLLHAHALLAEGRLNEAKPLLEFMLAREDWFLYQQEAERGMRYVEEHSDSK